MSDEQDRPVPDDLSLLLRSSRPQPQDDVAHLDRDKHTHGQNTWKVMKTPMQRITTVQYLGVLTWKSRFKNSLAKALFTLQIW